MTGRVKDELRTLLEQKQFDALPQLANQDGAVVRKLFSLLYDSEPLLRWRAVMGFGILAAKAPGKVGRTVSRLAYALNDEASICAWSTAPAVAEMAHHNPALTKEVVRIVVHYVEDAEACQSSNRNPVVLCSALWAAGRVGIRQPELIAEIWPTLQNYSRDALADVRGHAYWAMGLRGERHQDPIPMEGWNDENPATVFDPRVGDLITLPVREFARQAYAATVPGEELG
ncbi:MAG: hypothetical protein G8345_16920 [Magnetococcales bacterium]|nr:hypothetical protein [Magnetococcales bacterium]